MLIFLLAVRPRLAACFATLEATRVVRFAMDRARFLATPTAVVFLRLPRLAPRRLAAPRPAVVFDRAVDLRLLPLRPPRDFLRADFFLAAMVPAPSLES